MTPRWSTASIRVRLTAWYAIVLFLMLVVYASATFVAVRQEFLEQFDEQLHAFGFGGWVAMTKGTGGMDVMIGDLVLTQDEVNPVMSALLDNGLEATAIHNHFLWGTGPADKLATGFRAAVDLLGSGTSTASKR